MQHPTNLDDTQQASGDGGDDEPERDFLPSPARDTSPQDSSPHGSGVRRRRGRPTAAKPVGDGQTPDLILRQARRLFMQRGYASVAVGEVAEAVGVTKPTLYYHFGDKEGLYAAVLVDLMREVGGYIAAIVATPESVRARLERIALGYFRNANGTMEPMLRDVAQLIGQEHAATVWTAYEDEFLRPLTELLRAGAGSGEVRPLEGHSDERSLARAFLGLLDAFTAYGGRSARTPAEHQMVAQQVVALFLEGAAPRP